MIPQSSENSELLLSNAIADVSRTDNQIIVTPKYKMSEIEGCALILAWLISAFAALLSAFGVVFAWGTMGLVLICPLFLLAAWATIAIPVFATRYVDPPQFDFDLEQQRFSYCIPPFASQHRPLEDISAFEIARSRGVLHLRIEIKGRLRRIAILFAQPESRSDSKIFLEPVEVTLSRIQPIAEILATSLGKPLHVWTESSTWYSSRF